MLLPISWMKKYLDIDEAIMDIANKTTNTGSHVESVIKINEKLSNILVGKVLEIKEHNELLKLKVLKVLCGGKNFQIVTGAKNMKEGDYVVLACIGAIMPNGIEIKETDFKGIISEGMLCSYEELGYESSVIPKASKDGIIILSGTYNTGESIADILDIDKEVIEYEITPNRPDCLSIIGMAREVAAVYNKKVDFPDCNINKEIDNIKNYVEDVKIETENCERYILKMVKNIKIKSSPQWLQNHLMLSGVRPINNVVDVTNYVMLEMGQPIHAFDFSKMEMKKIIIRNAFKDEKLTTLDKIERNLNEKDIVIADANKGVAIAGVMGGLNSDVDENTTEILIEAAVFEKDTVRLTSKRLGLRTDASSRFEKGVSPEITEKAINRVCNILEKIEAGDVVAGNFDLYPKVQEKVQINCNVDDINKLLGTEISKDQMETYLNSLEFEVNSKGKELNIQVPYFRQDITIKEDIAEEIGRMFGFQNIKPVPVLSPLSKGEKSYFRVIEDELKNILCSLGFCEIVTYSFTGKKTFNKLNLNDNDKLLDFIEILNPLGEEFSIMRTSLIPNMLNVMEKNINYKIDDFRAFEIGNTFHKSNNELPSEVKKVCISLLNKYDFFDLKDIIVKILNQVGLNKLKFIKNDSNPIFHPGRCANIEYDNIVVGTLGQINYNVSGNYKIDKPVYLAELDLDIIVKNSNLNKYYKEVIKYPSISRDIAILVDKNISNSDIENVIYSADDKIVKKVHLFDVYSDDKLGNDKKSMAYNIVFQSDERTLKDEEVVVILDSIIAEIKEKFNGVLRV